MVKFATDYQLRYDDIIKEVFGVACLNDLSMMIQFNKSFQDSICKKDGITADKISLNCVIRIASRSELLQLKNQILADTEQNQAPAATIPCPFDNIIQLKDGIYQWDEEHSHYVRITVVA